MEINIQVGNRGIRYAIDQPGTQAMFPGMNPQQVLEAFGEVVERQLARIIKERIGEELRSDYFANHIDKRT